MNPIVDFIKNAGKNGLTAQDIHPLVVKMAGQDVPIEHVQSVLGDSAPPQHPHHHKHHHAPGDQQGAQQVPGGTPPPMPDPSAGGAGAPGGDPSAAMGAALGGGDPSSLAASMQGASPIDPALLAHIQSQHPSVNPDELAQIATDIAQALSQPDAGGAGGPPPGDPSAAPAGPGSSPEAPLNGIAGATDATKQASVAHRGLWMVKQAAYIYGFLGHALEKGASIEQAIELYRDALGKTAAYVERAEELEKISETIDDKTAEYCQGLAEQAQKRNLSVEQTIGLLKSSGVYDTLIQRMTSQK